MDMTLAVQRPFENHDGNYDTVFKSIALEERARYLIVKGVMIAVKEIQTKNRGGRTVQQSVVGERVTYLAPKTKNR